MMRDRSAMRDAQYTEFFMKSPERTSYKGNHSMKSTADSVIWGRDMDKSGDNPHSHFSRTYKDYAGSVTSDRSPRPFRMGQNAMASSADSVIWGRDIDQSGEGTHAKLRQSHAGYAGNYGGGDASPRPFRKPDYAMKSSADSVIWGRDIDNSGENPHDHFGRSYGGYAGSLSGERSLELPLGRSPRPSRKGDYSMRSTADEVIFGRDLDLSGEDPHQRFVAQFEGHAGMRAVSPRDARRVDWLCVPGSEEHPALRRARSADSARSPEGSTRTPSPSPSPRGRGRAPKPDGRLSVDRAGSVARTSSENSAGSRHTSPQPEQVGAAQRGGRLSVPGAEVEGRASSRRASSRRPAVERAASSRPRGAQLCERPRWR